jgi:hypothetical protein
MTAVELTKRFSDEQYRTALDSWDWLDIGGKAPRFASLFGDVFLQDRDGGWWFLNTFDGDLEALPDGLAPLDTEDGRDRYLLEGLAAGAYHRRGLRLNADQVYTYVPPPAVTGDFAVERITVFDFVVAVNLAGQLHRQLRDKPPGWQVTGFEIADE